MIFCTHCRIYAEKIGEHITESVIDLLKDQLLSLLDAASGHNRSQVTEVFQLQDVEQDKFVAKHGVGEFNIFRLRIIAF